MGGSSRLDILQVGWNQNMSHGQNGWRPLWYSVAFAEALLSHVYQTLEGDMVPSPKEITITVAITEMWRILTGAQMFIYLVNVYLYLSNILHISIKHFTHIYTYTYIYIYTVYGFMYMKISIYDHICNLHIYAWKNTCIYTYIYIYIIHIYIYEFAWHGPYRHTLSQPFSSHLAPGPAHCVPLSCQPTAAYHGVLGTSWLLWGSSHLVSSWYLDHKQLA